MQQNHNQQRRKMLLVFGTRPEAIKMAPLYNAFKQHEVHFETRLCVTAQHRQMLDQVVSFFGITPDYDMDLMRPNQTLYDITTDVILGIKPVLEDFQPDYVFVHGDTTTSMAVALGAFYQKVKVCHIEAGLRTYDKYSPFPEEMNRQLTARLTDIHFAPTVKAAKNLGIENIPEEKVVITGNTVIDALFYGLERIKDLDDEGINFVKGKVDLTKRVILITGHRRENFGQGFLNICHAIRAIADAYEDIQIVYPVHMNPNVKDTVFSILDNHPRITLLEPLAYPSFLWLMNEAYLILTDSGGIQEEAPSLGKPVLVMRDNTERPEAVEAGTVVLVGTNKVRIIEEVSRLLDEAGYYQSFARKANPYGDGQACKRVIEYFLQTKAQI